MAVLLGIDVGTQSIKSMLLDTEKGVLAVKGYDYGVSVPKIDFAEEDAEKDWWEGLKETLAWIKEQQPVAFDAIAAIGLTGQMHGFVPIDKDKKALAPAMVWVDQRSKKQVDEIWEKCGFEEMSKTLQNRVFTGFAFPSLLWIQQERPDLWEKLYTICMPKDFIRLKLTGEVGTDMTDASATTLFHMPNRNWHYDLLEKFGIYKELLPECHESYEVAGTVTALAAKETGLRAGIPVVYGSADQPAMMLGNGACEPGTIISNVGTGGVVAAASMEDIYDPQMRIHTFCNAVDNGYLLFGALLAGGLSLRWLKNNILNLSSYDELTGLAAQVPIGSDGLIYLPHLGGERTPHMDHNATGMFFGMRLIHDRRHMARAVVEGVTFGLMDSVAVFDELGMKPSRMIASGGGARSPFWLQVQADVYGHALQVTKVEEQTCLGACILAGFGTGIFSSPKEGCDALVSFDDVIYEPVAANHARYQEFYELYKQLYPQTKDSMKKMAGML